jgi:hypothetical protein
MIEFVEVDVDGAGVRIGLQVERDREARLRSAQWLAIGRLPTWTTPRANISVRGLGRDRTAAIADAMTRLNEAVARYEAARRQVSSHTR